MSNRASLWDLVIVDMHARSKIDAARFGEEPRQQGAAIEMYQTLLSLCVNARAMLEEQFMPEEPGELWTELKSGTIWRFVQYREANGSYPECWQFAEPDALPDALPKNMLHVNIWGAVALRRLVEPMPHPHAMAAEIRRLQAREAELLAANTRLVEERRAIDRQAMVRNFMRGFEQPIHDATQVPAELIRFRLSLVVEEVGELLRASLDDVWRPLNMQNFGSVPLENLDEVIGKLMALVEDAPLRVNLPELVDATVDIDYVVEGFRATLGLDSAPLWAMVHDANMAKRGMAGEVHRHGLKVIKPPGWEAPNIGRELERQGRGQCSAIEPQNAAK